MKSDVTPYRRFPGHAREAMEFYHDVFGGELGFSTFGETDPDSEVPDQIMHAYLLVDGRPLLYASDAGGMEITAGDDTPVALTGGADALDEIRGYWDRLSEDARIDVPLDKAPWGAWFGMLRDRFGTLWFVNAEA